MRRETKVLVYAALAGLFLAALLAVAQKPATAAAGATPAPQLTPAESYHLGLLGERYKGLQTQIEQLQDQQKQVMAEYQQTAQLIAGEHPGYHVAPNNQLVPDPAPPAKK